ncbi:nuclear envelope integral membrane protein 1-like protein, partial [Dinothrombium tinctorium]
MQKMLKLKCFQWQRKLMKPRKFLTEEEYKEEGARETKLALDTLREYCKSPHCDAWKVITVLRDPQKFADFMHGSPDISKEELGDYLNYLVDDRPEDNSQNSNNHFILTDDEE